MEQNLKDIEEFFKLNLKIKNCLLNCAPKVEDNYNTESIMKYGDKLYFELLDLKDYFIRICEILKLNVLSKNIDNLFKQYQKELLNSGYSYNKLKDFYEKNFSTMSEELVNEVKDSFAGYTIINPIA